MFGRIYQPDVEAIDDRMESMMPCRKEGKWAMAQIMCMNGIRWL